MKRLLRWLIRRAVYARLALWPPREDTAAAWAERFKRWPGIFGEEPFRRLVRLHGAQRMRLGIVDVIERRLAAGAEWDPAIGVFLARNLAPGATFVDVGANIGYFTLQAARLVGDAGTVVAVEPTHVNLARLCEHLWLNRAENVLVLSAAAGHGHALPHISFPTPGNAGAASLRAIHSVQGHRALQCSLDTLLEDFSLIPDVVKIDVEGYELEALKGMDAILRRARPLVVCELTDAFLRDLGQSARGLIEHMEARGYVCHLLDGGRAGMPRRLRSTDAELPTEQVDVVFFHPQRPPVAA